MTEAQSNGTAAVFNKVPAVTLLFWVIKILATTVGETAADVLSTTFKLGLVVTSYVMAAALIIALVFQFRARKYVPTTYWIAVVFISVVGTLISDNLVDNLGVSLATTTIIFSVARVAVFIWSIPFKRDVASFFTGPQSSSPSRSVRRAVTCCPKSSGSATRSRSEFSPEGLRLCTPCTACTR
jgi:uncharacterized membrane-anchored protein